MGDQKIKEELERVSKLFDSPHHENNLKELWPLVKEHFGDVENIEIISCNQTYKIILKDGRILKTFIWIPLPNDFLELLYKKGLPVPKPVRIIKRKNSNYYWRFVEWIKGESDRETLSDIEKLQSIDPHYWFLLGKLIAQIHNVCESNSEPSGDINIMVNDILWSNYSINDGCISLIDCKKFTWDYAPEKWIYHYVFFNKHHLQKQKLAFIDGYIEEIKGPRSRLDMIEAAKIFTERLYEKLAKQ